MMAQNLPPEGGAHGAPNPESFRERERLGELTRPTIGTKTRPRGDAP